MAIIELRHISKRFGTPANGTVAAHDLSFSLARGQLLALLGSSGCGKTTTLRLIAGLETPDTGEIWLNGQCVAGSGHWVPPEQRRIGMVFQDYALFPHLTIAQNIAFPISKQHRDVQTARVTELLQTVGLAGMGERYAHQLSGGQQQRVALARALANQPDVVLLDEPFSNLDAALRKTMRDDVRSILKQANATTIFVTHDQEEALSMADQVAVMAQGQLAQLGTPQQVYLRPNSRAIAAFLGEANFLPAQANGQLAECIIGQVLLASPAHGPVDLMIRPETLLVKPDSHGTAHIASLVFYGHDQMMHIQMGDSLQLMARSAPRPDLSPGDTVRVSVQGPAVAYPVAS